MKDHEKRELVNELRDIAVKFGSSQQLREKIARCVLPVIDAVLGAGSAHKEHIKVRLQRPVSRNHAHQCREMGIEVGDTIVGREKFGNGN